MSDNTISAVNQSANMAYVNNNSAGRVDAKNAVPVAKVAGVKPVGPQNVSGIGTGKPVQQVGSAVNTAVAQSASGEDVELAVQQVRDELKEVVPELDFSVDDDTGKIVVKLIDTATSEVLRQIPSEEMLHIATMIDKLQGILIKDKA